MLETQTLEGEFSTLDKICMTQAWQQMHTNGNLPASCPTSLYWPYVNLNPINNWTYVIILQ